MQGGLHDARDGAHLWPLHAGHGIEVHAQLVGMVEVLGAHRMRMQLQAGEVGEPRERGGVAWHDLLRGATRGEAQRNHVDPRRAGFRRPLLIEELAGDAVGVAHQHVRPAACPT